MTFSPDRGGIFDVFSSLVRRGLGGAEGPGTQFVSWIHQSDFARAMDLIISQQDLSGVINISAPNPLTNRDFMRALREAWNIPIGLPTAQWMIEVGAWLMRTESELVLKSRRVVPTRLLEAGFSFQFPEWPAAARDLVSTFQNDSFKAI